MSEDLEQAWLDQGGHHRLALADPAYPPLLQRIDGAPDPLYVAGDPALLWRPQVAIVGSRNPTASGLELARDFAAELTRAGLTVTSGLASGIDSAAHAGALDAGGVTIAVNGTGLDQVYPASSRGLARRIAASGAMVSELPPGLGPRRGQFPSRNRIISGLSLGVLVVEAGINSGSLITARLGAEQGREVFAIPGSVHNPVARGCHRLIRQGARLVESTADVLEELAPLARQLALDLRAALQADAAVEAATVEAPADDPDYARLLEAIGHDPVAVDALAGRTGFAARELSFMLLMLELDGRLERLPGGRVVRRRP